MSRHAGVWLTMGVAAAMTLSSTSSRAESIGDEALQKARVESLRQQMANQLHLQAYDLLDELVLSWMAQPPFAVDTDVVVADVTVPFGFGSGLEALLENHLADLVVKHPESRLHLAHCPACSAITVHADQTGTIVSRGIDQPGAMARAAAGTTAQHALFIDVEAEGSALVLRARITTLDERLAIVWAKTLTTSTSTAAMLRSGDHLVTAEQARSEYLDALQQRGPVAIATRVALQQFAPPSADEGTGGIAAVPLLWIQTGVELNLNSARDWSGNLVVGGTWVPQLYSGLMVEARVNRLLTGAQSSLTQPNLYGFVSGALISVNGPAALLLRDDVPNIADLLASVSGAVVETTTYPALSVGLDLRLGNRVGASLFATTTPTLSGSPNIGRWLDYGVVQVHSIGGEVSLWF